MIVFEGIDCSGKTTAINYIKDKLIQSGKQVMVLDDWFSDPLGKQKLLDEKNTETQVRIVLECRKRTHNLLQEIPKETVILFDRYILSTLVYQCFSFRNLKDSKPELNISKELLSEVLKTQIPYTLVYVKPTEDFDRKAFLEKRSKKDRFDNRKAYWDLRTYWHLLTFPQTLGLTIPETQVVLNNGKEWFFENLDSLFQCLFPDLSKDK